MRPSIFSRTIEELDGERWGEPDESASGLIREGHRLRTVPIGSLTDDDIRLLLRQGIGVNWLVPLALNRLEAAPLAGALYRGDLLAAVLGVGADYWAHHSADTLSLLNVRASLERVRTEADKLLSRDDWPEFA